ncbi:hypothetical protein D3C87_2026580 [compost metagenome]
MRIQAHRHQNEITAVGTAFAEIQDVVVPGVVDLQPQVRLQGRVLPANPVELGDFGNDIARCGEVPRADFILLGVEVFLLARHWRRFTEFEP